MHAAASYYASELRVVKGLKERATLKIQCGDQRGLGKCHGKQNTRWPRDHYLQQGADGRKASASCCGRVERFLEHRGQRWQPGHRRFSGVGELIWAKVANRGRWPRPSGSSCSCGCQRLICAVSRGSQAEIGGMPSTCNSPRKR